MCVVGRLLAKCAWQPGFPLGLDIAYASIKKIYSPARRVGGNAGHEATYMDSVSLASLALQLLTSIHSLSGYPVTTALPEIHQAPVAEIQQRFCQGTCAVQAFYRPGEGIYIDEKFDLANDEFARSVLLHELVHHMQRVSGTFQRMPSACDRWYAAEGEAYTIQNRYLETMHDPHRINVNAWRAHCDD